MSITVQLDGIDYVSGTAINTPGTHTLVVAGGSITITKLSCHSAGGDGAYASGPSIISGLAGGGGGYSELPTLGSGTLTLTAGTYYLQVGTGGGSVGDGTSTVGTGDSYFDVVAGDSGITIANLQAWALAGQIGTYNRVGPHIFSGGAGGDVGGDPQGSYTANGGNGDNGGQPSTAYYQGCGGGAGGGPGTNFNGFNKGGSPSPTGGAGSGEIGGGTGGHGASSTIAATGGAAPGGGGGGPYDSTGTPGKGANGAVIITGTWTNPAAFNAAWANTNHVG